jgi:tyrosyl-tRNA synthetase
MLKKRLAREIVAQFHGADAAEKAEADFERVFQRREIPEGIAEFSLPEQATDMATLLVSAGLAKSRGEARRLMAQGAVEIMAPKDGGFDIVKVSGDELKVDLRDGNIVRVGKHRWIKIVK